MSKLILLDSRLYVGQADLSGSGNQIEVSEEFETKVTTNWRSGGAREVKGGLASVEISAGGQWEAGTGAFVDEAFWAQRRTLDPWSAAPEGDGDLAAGGPCYLTRALRTKTQYFGAVGDVAPWEASAVGDWPLVRGMTAHPSMVPRTATGTGTALLLGAVSSTQKIYANLHVLSVAGTSTPTITAKIQSDDNSGFTTPTDRGSFAAATIVSGEAIRVAGPFTDTYWRVAWTISGSTPSFLFFCSMGIE